MAKMERPPGPTAQRVAANVRALRRAAGLDLADVAERMSGEGQPLATNGVSRVELGSRRVDVDDLIAIALALDVSPLAVLLPREADGSLVAITPTTTATSENIWRWASGTDPLPQPGHLDLDAAQRFREASAPHLREAAAVTAADLDRAADAMAPVVAALRAACASGVQPAVALAFLRLALRTDDMRDAIAERVSPTVDSPVGREAHDGQR